MRGGLFFVDGGAGDESITTSLLSPETTWPPCLGDRGGDDRAASGTWRRWHEREAALATSPGRRPRPGRDRQTSGRLHRAPEAEPRRGRGSRRALRGATKRRSAVLAATCRLGTAERDEVLDGQRARPAPARSASGRHVPVSMSIAAPLPGGSGSGRRDHAGGRRGTEDVVVLGQEAHRRGRRGRPRGVGEVEELHAALVAEGAQAGPQALHHLAQPRQPAPRLHVADRGRAEGAEVAEHEVIERRRLLQPAAEERLEARVRRRAVVPRRCAAASCTTGR